MSRTKKRSIRLIEELCDFMEDHIEETRKEIEEAKNDDDVELSSVLRIQDDFSRDFTSKFAIMKNNIREMHGF